MTPSPTPAELHDIAPPVPVFPYSPWVVIVAAAGLLVLLGFVVWLIISLSRRKSVVIPPTPQAVALSELERARSRIPQMTPYEFSILVSDILRSYVVRQYSLPATEQTSPEFLAAVKRSPAFSDAEQQLLADFLDKADLLKYARAAATTGDSATLLAQAVLFVKGAK